MMIIRKKEKPGNYNLYQVAAQCTANHKIIRVLCLVIVMKPSVCSLQCCLERRWTSLFRLGLPIHWLFLVIHALINGLWQHLLTLYLEQIHNVKSEVELPTRWKTYTSHSSLLFFGQWSVCARSLHFSWYENVDMLPRVQRLPDWIIQPCFLYLGYLTSGWRFFW